MPPTPGITASLDVGLMRSRDPGTLGAPLSPQRLEQRLAFVLNPTPPRSYRIRDAADGLAVLGVLPDVNIVMRNDHQDAIGLGKGVTEYNPKGAAAQEIRQLWQWMEKRTQATSERIKQGLKNVQAA